MASKKDLFGPYMDSYRESLGHKLNKNDPDSAYGPDLSSETVGMFLASTSQDSNTPVQSVAENERPPPDSIFSNGSTDRRNSPPSRTNDIVSVLRHVQLGKPVQRYSPRLRPVQRRRWQPPPRVQVVPFGMPTNQREDLRAVQGRLFVPQTSSQALEVVSGEPPFHDRHSLGTPPRRRVTGTLRQPTFPARFRRLREIGRKMPLNYWAMVNFRTGQKSFRWHLSGRRSTLAIELLNNKNTIASFQETRKIKNELFFEKRVSGIRGGGISMPVGVVSARCFGRDFHKWGIHGATHSRFRGVGLPQPLIAEKHFSLIMVSEDPRSLYIGSTGTWWFSEGAGMWLQYASGLGVRRVGGAWKRRHEKRMKRRGVSTAGQILSSIQEQDDESDNILDSSHVTEPSMESTIYSDSDGYEPFLPQHPSPESLNELEEYDLPPSAPIQRYWPTRRRMAVQPDMRKSLAKMLLVPKILEKMKEEAAAEVAAEHEEDEYEDYDARFYEEDEMDCLF